MEFTYNAKLIKSLGKTSINVKDKTINEVLGQLLNTGIEFLVVNDGIVIKPKPSNEEVMNLPILPGVAVAVTGTVSDESGMAMPGVNIIEKNTTNGTTTDENGKFSISVADGSSVLVFSFIGYATKDVPVNGQTTLNVSLNADSKTLAEMDVPPRILTVEFAPVRHYSIRCSHRSPFPASIAEELR